MNKNDGMNYAPVGKPQPVVQEGEFVFAAAALDHGHIYGMCNGLIEAGATLKWVYDPDPVKVDAFVQQYPQVQVARSLEVILSDDAVRLVAGAAIPSGRCALGLKAMAAGKDYFTDKAPLTTLEQLADAKAMVEKTGKKYAVSSVRVKKFCATTQFDATKVHQSGFVAPYTLSEGLDRTLQYEFVAVKKDDITFVSE